jgi:hypothetical protein
MVCFKRCKSPSHIHGQRLFKERPGTTAMIHPRTPVTGLIHSLAQVLQKRGERLPQQRPISNSYEHNPLSYFIQIAHNVTLFALYSADKPILPYKRAALGTMLYR